MPIPFSPLGNGQTFLISFGCAEKSMLPFRSPGDDTSHYLTIFAPHLDVSKYVYDGQRLIKPRGGHPLICAPPLNPLAYLVFPLLFLHALCETRCLFTSDLRLGNQMSYARSRIWINIYLGRRRKRKLYARGFVDPIKSKQPSGVLAFSLGT